MRPSDHFRHRLLLKAVKESQLSKYLQFLQFSRRYLDRNSFEAYPYWKGWHSSLFQKLRSFIIQAYHFISLLLLLSLVAGCRPVRSIARWPAESLRLSYYS